MAPAQTLGNSLDPASITLSFHADGDWPVEVTVYELSVAAVRAWLVETESARERDPLHALALENSGIDDLSRLTDCGPETLERLTVRQLAVVEQTARELNPHFFRVRAALDSAARTLKNEAIRLASSPSVGSTGTSPG